MREPSDRLLAAINDLAITALQLEENDDSHLDQRDMDSLYTLGLLTQGLIEHYCGEALIQGYEQSPEFNQASEDTFHSQRVISDNQVDLTTLKLSVAQTTGTLENAACFDSDSDFEFIPPYNPEFFWNSSPPLDICASCRSQKEELKERMLFVASLKAKKQVSFCRKCSDAFERNLCYCAWCLSIPKLRETHSNDTAYWKLVSEKRSMCKRCGSKVRRLQNVNDVIISKYI